MKAMQAFWQLLQQAPRRRVLALLLCMTAAGLTEGVGLLLLVPLLEVLDGQRSHNPLVQQLLNALTALGLPASVGGLLLAFVALVALRSAVQYARERLGASLQQHLVDQLRLRCFAALLAVEWRWLVNTRRADHANLLLTDVSRVGVGLHFGLGLLATAATLLAYLAVAFALSWRMSLLALAGGVLVFGLLSGQRNRAMQLGKNLSQASRALHGNVQESLAGIKLAKILATEPAQLDFFTRTTERLRTQQLEFVADTSASRALFQFGGAALLAAYLYLGLSVWQTPVPLLLTLVLVFSRLIPMLMSVHQQMHHWLHALPALQQTQDLLAQCQRHAEPGFGVADADHTAPAALSLTQTICLDAVSVTYAERERPALVNISLQFAARTTSAIMGASGAGKSTLADVLMGLLTPDQGELRVDGVPVTGASRHAWRRQVAYVQQEVFLFHDTVRRNLLWGQPQASDAQLAQALQSAAAEFVWQLPQGIDTMVGDGGVRLSGGERQRLALARALLKRPSLLILDEATSALDLDNEARIRLAIEQLHGDLTVVIIGHRLPTLEHADQVIVLDAGRVCAQGTWAEVRQQQGAFS